jgi:hypothetical protein
LHVFSVSSFTGALTLLRSLDAENDQPYTVRVSTAEARDMERSSDLAHSALVSISVVDVNDWIPNFESNSYSFAITASTSPGTIVGQVAAFDQDRDVSCSKR